MLQLTNDDWQRIDEALRGYAGRLRVEGMFALAREYEALRIVIAEQRAQEESCHE